VTAVALLGLRDLAPAVMRAWDRGAIDDVLMTREEFAFELDQAEQSPGDIERFEVANLGYIEDVLAELQKFPDMDDDAPEELGEALPSLSPPSWGEQAVNPWRHVGRNDPCPCGSGKKAKRCCLTS
jgi:SEC-C motif